jgi:CheY-like chemotaxis protein
MMAEDGPILVVEDRADDVLIILKAFTAAEIKNRVIVARDGEEAIQYLNGDGQFRDRHQFPLPRLILLDLKMPKVDGFEVLKWVKGHPALKTIPVLVLTLSSEIRDVNAAYKLGANSFMVKPDDFYNVTSVAKLLKDYWLQGNKAPGQIRDSSPRAEGD